MLKGKLKFVVALLIIGATVSYLVFSGVKDTMVYYLTIEELMAKVPDVYNNRVRISGIVVPGTIKNDIDGGLEFKITDGKNIIDIQYKGIIPDIFRDEVEAVVEGEYKTDNVFKADVLLAKCPTKYESEEELKSYNKENT